MADFSSGMGIIPQNSMAPFSANGAPMNTGMGMGMGMYPNYGNIMTGLQQPLTAGNDYYKSAINTLQPTASSPVGPGTQQILDLIQRQGDIYKGQNQADASSYAISRGIGGSSTDILSRIQAGSLADQATLNSRTSTLLQGQQYQQNALGAIANLQGAQGNLANQYQGQAQLSGANLTSDEVASQRNMILQQQALALQQQLGLAGIQQGQNNIDAAQQIAQQQARNQLLMGGAQLLVGGGGLFGGGGFFGGGSGGGGGNGLFSGLGNAFSGTTAGGGAVPYAGGGSPASSLFPGGVGPVGTNTPGLFGQGGTLFNTAGTSSLGVGNILPGLGGYYAGTQAFGATQSGDQGAMNVGGALGAFAGSAFGPLGSAAGGFLGAGYGKASNRLVNGINHSLGNTAGSIARYANPVTAVSAVANKVSSVFRF